MGYRTIFHIDDDDDDIDFFSAAVTQLSAMANCVSFNDSATAMQKLINGEVVPDAIFLDLNIRHAY
jgi:hypothetical protein